MPTGPVLIMLHVDSNAGYAIDSLVQVFLQMATILSGDENNVHISFTHVGDGRLSKVLGRYAHVIEYDPASRERAQLSYISSYIQHHGIEIVFGFDQPVWQPSYKYMRKAGARKIISYQGAPMSRLNTGLVLWLKRLEVRLTADMPDHYIFESEAMAETAYKGRGIPKEKTSIVYLGVDTDRFLPAKGESFYAHQVFDIPLDRRIVYYSGHMSKRKGVEVLIYAAKFLYENHNRRDYHFLILGNKAGEEKRFQEILGASEARSHVTFGGYRKDVEKIIPSCYSGAISSTGWDSFTMSSIEIAACGLPLIVSNLQGLAETIEPAVTGYLFPPGDYKALATHIVELLDRPGLRDDMGARARSRVLKMFTLDKQLQGLVNAVSKVVSLS